MARVIDISGQTFGRWTVVARATKPDGIKSASAYWLCKCECGAERSVSGKDLRNGDSASCGCTIVENNRRKAADLAGQTFGRITVIERAGSNKRGSAVWRCSCSCGNSLASTPSTSDLRTGNTTSCGCASVIENPIYESMHNRIRAARGSASTYSCIGCEEQAAEWSYTGNAPDERSDIEGKNAGKPFTTDMNFYVPRCRSCHQRHDRAARAAHNLTLTA